MLFLVSVALFVLAIELLKGGARSTVPLIVNGLGVNSLPNALGLGCFSAYLIMSGSPVAAVGLALLDAGALDRLQVQLLAEMLLDVPLDRKNGLHGLHRGQEGLIVLWQYFPSSP